MRLRTILPACCLAIALMAGGCGGGGSSGTSGGREVGGAGLTDGSLRVAAMSALERPSPTQALRADGRRIVLQAARGEREGAQLAISSRARGDYSVAVSHLRGAGANAAELPVGSVELYEAQPMRVDEASPGGTRGVYFDPLLPIAPNQRRALQPRRASLVWLDVSVPRRAAPGSYSGVVTVRHSDGSQRTLPISVRVEAATLPVRPTLHSSIGTDQSQVSRFEKVREGAPAAHREFEAYVDRLADARLSPADIPLSPAIGEQPPAAFSASEEGRRFESISSREGVASIRVPIYQTYPYDDPLNSDRAQTVRYLRQAAAYLRGRGWLERSYVYVLDEPSDDLADDVREWHELVREADPGLRLLVTREPNRAMRGAVDIWVANISARVEPAAVRAALRNGKGYWWYPSVTSQEPYPTLFVDDRRPSARAMGWLAFRLGVQGFLYWSATHWHEVSDPWTQPGSFRDPEGAIANGDGVLLYPGRPRGLAAPAPSVRLLQLRDGIEDHDLLAMARDRHGASAVGPVTEALATSTTNFTDDADVVARQRKRLFRLLNS